MPRYETILFDADNTLFDFYRAEREALTDTLFKMGVAPSEEMIGVYSRINSSFWKRLEKREITKEQLRVARFVSFCEHYGLQLDAEQMALTYTEFLSAKSYLMPDAEWVCAQLAPVCRLYIVTNGIATVQRGRFEPSCIRPYFKRCFVSEEIGCEKPDRAYFDAVMAAIPAFKADKTLVVGDSLSSDMAGGIGAGLPTCWFNPQNAPLPENLPITHVITRLRDVVPLVLNDA